MGAATLKVTVMLAGEFCAPVEATEMWPVYVPAASAPSAAEICKDCGAVPLAGVTESHDESLVAVKVRVPELLLVRFTLEVVGLVPLPSVALKDKADCERERTGTDVLALPYAESVQLYHREPADQVDAREVRLDCELVWLMQLEPESRYFRVPPVPRMAIQ